MELPETLTAQYTATEADHDRLWAEIINFNKTTGPMLDHPPYERFPILIRDETGEVVAGILTKILLKTLYVELLWVSEAFRKSGLGSKLLMESERIARQHECRMCHLDTFSFQAIDFYLKFDYEIFGVLDDYPNGVKRYYLKKRL